MVIDQFMRNPEASGSSTSSNPALGSRNNYIWLIARTQDMIWSNNSVIIYNQMERPIDRQRWIYAVSVRRVDLHPWPSLICPWEGNWYRDALGQQWPTKAKEKSLWGRVKREWGLSVTAE